MAEVMRDPVELPSGNVLDRKVAMRIIMSGDYDPFTKVPALHLHPLLLALAGNSQNLERAVRHNSKTKPKFAFLES